MGSNFMSTERFLSLFAGNKPKPCSILSIYIIIRTKNFAEIIIALFADQCLAASS